jgi:hypothetical protein
MDETIDTGFASVFAGEKWEEPSAPPFAKPLPSGEVEPAVTPAYGVAEDVTAAVTIVDEPTKQAMKSLVRLPDIPYEKLAQLARDVAMDIKERHIVLSAHSLTQAQYEYLETHNEFYISALKAACIEWHAPLSTQERIKLEAAAILEDSLPGLGSRLQNTREQLPGVVEAAKLFAKIAGVGERDTGPSTPGERFVINIDLGGGQKTVVSTGPSPEQIAGPAGGGAAPGNSWASEVGEKV